MIVTIKTLSQKSFTINVNDTETVKELKEKIEKEKGKEYPASCQKLIYAGKILTDNSTLSQYSIEEGKFIVIMVTKPKTAEPSASNPATEESKKETSGESAAATPTPTDSTKEEKKESDKKSDSTPASESATTTNIASAESALVMGDEYQNMVKNIVDMGYDRSKVEKALKASFNNPERAVEYLISGIPQMEETEPSPQQPTTQPSQHTPASIRTPATNTSSESSSSADPLGFLRSHPYIRQLRLAIQENPSLLHAVLQEIGTTNPELLQVISQNQDGFVRLLNEPIGQGSPAAAPASGESAEGDDSSNQFSGVLQISPEDKEAIDRLTALGFAEELVVQAYFACEKNETLAANFLLSQAGDD
ncbi:UV excision repair protein RAD23 B [Nymphon striatum]|nr:UV excision repair protein RAD23 B [Nymphon striatum]